MITITIQYFAMLREQRGVASERLTIEATTPQVLYDTLRRQYGFTLPQERIRSAVNGGFVISSIVLCDGDEVVFIPPVAGG